MSTQIQSALTVNNIHKAFGSAQVLKGISLEAHKGDVISILGASGSGKSTFLRCINLLETPDEGSIVLDGETIELKRQRNGRLLPGSTRQVETMRSKLGMVFQSFNLWSHMTVLQNVIEGPMRVLKRSKAECVEEAEQLLHKVLRVMRSLAEEGRTMLVVTHEMGFARHVSNRVVFMANGLIDAQGTPAELFEGLPTERFRQFVSSHTQRSAE
eukprot:gene22120-26252_t